MLCALLRCSKLCLCPAELRDFVRCSGNALGVDDELSDGSASGSDEDSGPGGSDEEDEDGVDAGLQVRCISTL